MSFKEFLDIIKYATIDIKRAPITDLDWVWKNIKKVNIKVKRDNSSPRKGY